jgi:hypothetical protein
MACRAVVVECMSGDGVVLRLKQYFMPPVLGWNNMGASELRRTTPN